MKYYLITESQRKKDFGESFPQSQKAIHYDRDSPNHIENNFGIKIEFKPIISCPIVNKKARITDLIGSVSNLGNLQISTKLKSVIEKYTGKGIQYFRNTVLHNEQEYTDYWLLHPYQFDHEYIDFQNSMIKYKKKADDYKTSRKTNIVFLSLNTLQEFEGYKEKARKKLETITIEKLFLKENVIKKDFFALRYVFGGMFYVSEKLKKEIENQGCTGLEFQPSYLSYYEWRTEREKVYGKI
ncbi:imm11 family protein [Chryseobacterium potabilaquae]|uniref:Immunity MXAN-0049 protein domain-containing protein n=1 Tax=Chryseobacterium potabilaquae TaxID=2675057 RepID=A0A6N4XBF0_9FLAO|nr:DUF1629 domain-containing protein [Chryseobacterium potabilaquae]CAA7196976.1 hypothetical protein CHRY9293_03034 [Chryseobacterium potabilaquae]